MLMYFLSKIFQGQKYFSVLRANRLEIKTRTKELMLFDML